MNQKDYLFYVEQAKKEIKAIEGHQIRICEYASKACTIKHGGKSKGLYTLLDFAKDTGIEYKTLNNWMLAYRNVVQKLDKPITTSAEFNKARRVESYLREQRTALNRAEGKPVGSRYGSKAADVPAETIRSIYNQIDEGTKPFEAEFANILRTSKHTLELLKKRDLNIAKDHELLYLMDMLDKASDLINNHLTKKRKLKGKAA